MMRAIILLLAIAAVPAAGAAERDYTEAMAREHAGDLPVAGAAAGSATHNVQHEIVDYGPARGYLARPDGEPRAGLIVIHEWWGLNDNIREMTRRLAAAGYLALAVDLYEGEVAEEADQARQLMSALMAGPDRADLHLRSAYQWLKDEGGMARVGSLGWCLGGALSLRAAMMLPEELDAAVIYYGRLETDPARLAPIMMPVLGIFGSRDRGIPMESVRAFETALQALGKTHQIVVYDADHAFANPSGTRYDPAAAAEAWELTLAFLSEHL
jgi:carboxymethylenebutenolidase